MLDKIIRIKSIGRFRDYAANGDVSFRKLNLIYAENGRGKTTLCAILRSLQSGRKEFITERKTLADTSSCEIFLRVNGAEYRFTNGTWSTTYPDIHIFDPVFINENVCSGDYVEHEHKKNLYRVIVGAQGVQLAEQIETLDGLIREANNELRAKKQTLALHVPQGTVFEDYLGWKPIADIDKQINDKTDELDAQKRHTAKSEEIQARRLLSRISLPSLPEKFWSVLQEQLADVSATAEAKVRQQIAKHHMEHQGESWLSQGLGYVKNDRCPFCGQEVTTAEGLLVAYRSYFSAAYTSLKKRVTRLSLDINSAISDAALSPVQQALADNTALAEFWKQFTTVDLPDLSFTDIQQRYAALRECSLALAERKQQGPTEAVSPDQRFTTALAEVEVLRPVFDAYNMAVDAANVRVSEQKKAVHSQTNITVLRNQLDQLEARKKRNDPEVSQACEAYQGAVTAKTALEQQKESVRQRLDQHCESIFRNYERSINEHLDQFNAGFRIRNTRHRYTGGSPSSQYEIEINSTPLQLGDAKTPAGTPCFKTALSSGDRSALALAFFLAVVKQDAEVERKIVVFDDPFTSLDRFRRTCTQQLIQRLAESAKQIIVLSHDPFFLKLLFDEFPSATSNIKTLQMSRAGDTTVIGEWDIQAEVQSSYMKDFSALLSFYRERKGEPRFIAKTIRPFLEGMLRVRFPGHFQQNEWLGDFIEKIRMADATCGLQHVKTDLPELEAINSYSKRYHHQQNANADSEPINEDELHGYVKRTLRLVGGS